MSKLLVISLPYRLATTAFRGRLLKFDYGLCFFFLSFVFSYNTNLWSKKSASDKRRRRELIKKNERNKSSRARLRQKRSRFELCDAKHVLKCVLCIESDHEAKGGGRGLTLRMRLAEIIVVALTVCRRRTRLTVIVVFVAKV